MRNCHDYEDASPSGNREVASSPIPATDDGYHKVGAATETELKEGSGGRRDPRKAVLPNQSFNKG
jgi:hypothetical protein